MLSCREGHRSLPRILWPRMPLRNRVTPLSALVADPARGLVYGNRGCLHDEQGEIRRRFNGKRWIACRLEFRGWKRTQLLQPGRFTELFFLDEATAFAAGHRPCFECRRADADRFARLWGTVHGSSNGSLARARAGDIDRDLHRQRVGDQGEKLAHRMRIEVLPVGAMLRSHLGPLVIVPSGLARWTPAGYEPVARGDGTPTNPVEVLTPPGIVAVIACGYRPMLHGSAGDLA